MNIKALILIGLFAVTACEKEAATKSNQQYIVSEDEAGKIAYHYFEQKYENMECLAVRSYPEKDPYTFYLEDRVQEKCHGTEYGYNTRETIVIDKVTKEIQTDDQYNCSLYIGQIIDSIEKRFGDIYKNLYDGEYISEARLNDPKLSAMWQKLNDKEKGVLMTLKGGTEFSCVGGYYPIVQE